MMRAPRAGAISAPGWRCRRCLAFLDGGPGRWVCDCLSHNAAVAANGRLLSARATVVRVRRRDCDHEVQTVWPLVQLALGGDLELRRLGTAADALYLGWWESHAEEQAAEDALATCDDEALGSAQARYCAARHRAKALEAHLDSAARAVERRRLDVAIAVRRTVRRTLTRAVLDF
jgi:hypothetical protein